MIAFLILLLIVGIVLYLIPFDAQIRTWIYVVLAILFVVALTNLLFGWPPFPFLSPRY